MSLPQPVQFSILDLICDLLKDQMSLADDQVWIYNQKVRMLPKYQLYVCVALRGVQPFGTTSVCEDDEAGNFTEFQSINVQETYLITLYSRDESALTRAPEAVMAMTGVLSQQIQEQYGFRLGPLPVSVTDTSMEDGAAILYRTDITINALRFRRKDRVIAYFDQFPIPPTIHTNQ